MGHFTDQPPNHIPQPLDLTKLSRGSNNFMSTIRLPDHMGHNDTVPWITVGQLDVVKSDGERRGSRWRVRSYLGNCTDFEHDSASILSFEIVAASFPGFFRNTVHVDGWIDPADVGSFRVPRPEYDPMIGAASCKDCKGKDRHMMVKEGFYVPPPNYELFDKIRGARIEIAISIRTQ